MNERRGLPIVIEKFGVRQNALKFSELTDTEKKLYHQLGRLLRARFGDSGIPLHIRMDLLTLMRLYREQP